MEEKLIKDFLEAVKDLMTGETGTLAKKVDARFDEAIKEKAVVSIEKFEDGRATTRIEGSNLSVLIALAGLEKTVFEKLEVPEGLWEMVKEKIGTKEAE